MKEINLRDYYPFYTTDMIVKYRTRLLICFTNTN